MSTHATASAYHGKDDLADKKPPILAAIENVEANAVRPADIQTLMK